ncbi:MAG: hypothetical protein AABY83_10490 [Pseudomonadota bacterium]
MKLRVHFLIWFFIAIPKLYAANLPDDAWRKIRAGEIWVRELAAPTAPTRQFEAVALTQANVAEFERVLLDFSRYPQFMPHVTRVTIVRQTTQQTELEYSLGLPLGITKKYRLAMTHRTLKNGFELAWRKIAWPGLEDAESIRDTQGVWRVTVDTQRGDQVLVDYIVATDPGDIPFGVGWVADMLSKQSVPEVVEKTRARVVQQRGARK